MLLYECLTPCVAYLLTRMRLPLQVYYPAHSSSLQLRRSNSFQRLEHATAEVTRGSPLLARSSWLLEPEQACMQPLLLADICLHPHVLVRVPQLRPNARLVVPKLVAEE